LETDGEITEGEFEFSNFGLLAAGLADSAWIETAEAGF
jgi:hypothetical protein